MSSKDTEISDDNPRNDDPGDTGRELSGDQQPVQDVEKRREIGGRKGPDPTRYGDWEKAGRCIDF